MIKSISINYPEFWSGLKIDREFKPWINIIEEENGYWKTTKETLEKYKWKIFFISAEYCSEELLDDDYDGIEIKEVFPKEITKTVYVDKKWNEVI